MNNNNPKRFWSFIKSKTKSRSIPTEVSLDDQKASSSTDKAQLFNNFFASVFTVSPDIHDNDYDERKFTDNAISSLTCCKAEEEKLLVNLNVSKAHGPDGITARMLREAAPAISASLTKLFNLSIQNGQLPDDWKIGNITPVHKKGKKELVENYRPISLTSLVVKTLERLIYNRVFAFVDSNNLLSNQQYGFRPVYSCTSQLILLFHTWDKNLDERSSTDVIFLDFEKAFDSVPHDRLLLKLNQYGISGELLTWFSKFLTNRYQRVVLEGYHSDLVLVRSGVPQGSILGPLLFLLYVNDIPDHLSSTTVMFADDTLLYDRCPSTETSISIQESLDQANEWCGKWLLRTNAKKCEPMKFTRARKPASCNYSIDNKPLSQVSTHKHLGVILSEDLSWKSHILSITARANRLLGLLKRTFGIHSKALLVGYKIMVRPLLEYACQVWDPHEKYLVEKLERVQRNVTRWIIGRDTSYEDRMKSIKLPSLTQRKEYLGLVQLFKFVGGHSAVNIDDFVSFNKRSSRNSHCYKLYKPSCRTNILKYSFWHRYIDKWNSLPESLVKHDKLYSFKKGLEEILYV